MSNFYKSLKTASKYIRRNRFLTVSCVFAMSFSLFLSLAFTSSAVYSHFLLKSLEERAQLTVFFKPTTKEDVIFGLKKTMEANPEVDGISYVSQEQALRIYLGQHQNDPTLLESVSSSVLPASLEIKTKKLDSLEPLAVELRKNADVDEVVFFKDVVNTFSKWAFGFRTGGLFLVLISLLVSLLVILLAVGVSVKIRADEIEIMRLVGATDSQVSLPFVLQGTFYGFLSSVVSFIFFILFPVSLLTAAKINISSFPLYPEIPFFVVGVIIIHFLLGPLLGLFSSFLGIRKYLKL